MSFEELLKCDWNSYELRKLAEGNDPGIFNCKDDWELSFLNKNLWKLYPFLGEAAIKAAIAHCCDVHGDSIPRALFIETLFSKLLIRA